MRKLQKLSIFFACIALSLQVLPAIAEDRCAELKPDSDLTGCNFSNQDLRGYDLTNSVLDQANLTGTQLSGANLTNVRGQKIVGAPKNLPPGWITLSGFLLGPKANLSSLNLDNVNLTNANLNSANLSYASMRNANLTNVDLGNANLERVYGNAIQGTPLALPSDWSLQKGYLIGPKANLSSLSISDIDFRDLNIDGATFTRSSLTNCNLSGQDMSSVQFDFTRLIDTKIDGTVFVNSDLEGLISRGVTGTPDSLPLGWVLRNGFLFGPYADLNSADLRNINFADIDLTDVNLVSANLSNSNLAGVDLRNTRIRGANLSGANLTGTNLTGVDITGLVAANIIGEPIGLNENWTIFNNFLIGPTANLSTTDFSGLDLRGLKLSEVNLVAANLSGTNLAGMDFDGANLASVNLSGANISGTSFAGANFAGLLGRDMIGIPDGLPTNWKLRSGYLIGPQANLNQADLSGMNLSGMNLSEASLAFADLRNADLSGTTITGAYLENANLAGATLLNVVSGGIVGNPIGLPQNFTFSEGSIKAILVLSPTPTITGLAKVGSTLTAVSGNWDQGVALSYQWSRNGVPISGATLSTYTPIAADYKKGLSVTVTGTGTGGVNRSKTSMDKPIAVGTMKVTTPKITGTIAKGKTVSASSSLWAPGAKLTYSWLLDGKAIKGATKKTYKILATQVGKKLSVLIKQTATGYSTATKVSTASKIR